MLRSKEEALRCAEREARAKDLEIAALKGDLAGEQRLKAAVASKLEEASSERDEVGRRLSLHFVRLCVFCFRSVVSDSVYVQYTT